MPPRTKTGSSLIDSPPWRPLRRANRGEIDLPIAFQCSQDDFENGNVPK
jgi:hypothetical protein